MSETFVLLPGSCRGGWAWEPDGRALPAGAWHPGMSSRLGMCNIVETGGSHEVVFTRPAQLACTLTEAASD